MVLVIWGVLGAIVSGKRDYRARGGTKWDERGAETSGWGLNTHLLYAYSVA
jgi:hypothetical protein